MPRPRRAPLLVGLLLAAFATPRAQPVAHPPSPAPAAAFGAIGPLATAPIAIAPVGDDPTVFLGLIGDAGVGRAAWLSGLPRHGDGLLALDLPRGIRVLRSVSVPGRVFLFAQSVASLDQPDGAYGVLAVGVDGSVELSPSEEWAFLFVSGPEDLPRAVASLRPAPGLPGETSELLNDRVQRLIATAARSPRDLARAISPSGMFATRQHQRMLHGELTELRREDFAGHLMMPTVMAAVRAAARAACAFPRCEFDGGVLGFERTANNQVFLRALGLRADLPAPLPRAASNRREVSARAGHADTDRVLREAEGSTRHRVLAEAPLTALGGSIAVALPPEDADADEVTLVTSEASAMRITRMTIPSGETGHQVRFADLDGDGRTDALLRTVSATAPGASYFVMLAPPPSMEPPRTGVDPSFVMATVGAPDIDTALRAALAIPSRGVTARNACALLRGTNTLAGFRRIAARGARVIEFNEPALPAFHPTVLTAAELTHEQVSGLGATCPALRCLPDRPYCYGTWEPAGPGSQHYFFTWERGALRLLGFADYYGS